MRGPYRTLLILPALALGLSACLLRPPSDEAETGSDIRSSSSDVRASRRAFDGAPPIIPHVAFGASCTECHNERGVAVPDVGFAPASPHSQTAGMQFARCRQCHAFQNVPGVFRASRFRGLLKDATAAHRAHALAPPVIPHSVFMREDCLACHTGAAAREEIRTTHPERERCQQCHLEQRAGEPFPVGSS